MDPDNRRIMVKLDASIAPLPNARRQSTELAANAINAIEVRMNVFNIEWGFILDAIKNIVSIYCLDRVDYLRKTSKNIFPVSHDGPLVIISSTL